MNKRDELISVLLDGECTPEELDRVVENCDESAALRERYGRWCLVREAMQGTRISTLPPPEFCSGVIAGLDRPQASPARRSARLSVRRRWRPVAGLALAASLGALCTVGVTQWHAGSGSPSTVAAAGDPGGSSSLSVAAVDGKAHPVALREMQWGQLDADSARKLDDYVLEHSSDHAGTVMGGDAFGYARMAARAGYDAGDGSP